MADYLNDEMQDRTNSEDEETKDAFELLDRLEKMAQDAKAVPFSSNCVLNREELLMMIGMVRDALPAQLSQSKWLIEQSRELLETAREQADNIVDDAQHEVQQMIDEHEITQQAREYAQETVDKANQEAEEIRSGAVAYTERRLTNLENQLTEILVTVRKHKQELKE